MEQSQQHRFDGHINQEFFINRTITIDEHIEWYNKGNILNPQDVFGNDCVWFFNPANSGSTAQFSVVDAVNSITATSFNMVDIR